MKDNKEKMEEEKLEKEIEKEGIDKYYYYSRRQNKKETLSKITQVLRKLEIISIRSLIILTKIEKRLEEKKE